MSVPSYMATMNQSGDRTNGLTTMASLGDGVLLGWRLVIRLDWDCVYLLGLRIVFVEKGLNPVSIVWMDSLQILDLHEEPENET